MKRKIIREDDEEIPLKKKHFEKKTSYCKFHKDSETTMLPIYEVDECYECRYDDRPFGMCRTNRGPCKCVHTKIGVRESCKKCDSFDVMGSFKFGKYKGERYEETLKKDPEYIEWVSKQSWLNEKTKELLNVLILKDERKIIYDKPLPNWTNKLFDKKMQTLCSIKFKYK